MRIAALLIVLAGGFEILWARNPALHHHRAHFRSMVALFWGLTFLLWAGSAWGLLPASLYFNAVPRFASDALTYQAQATYVAEGLRSGSMGALLDLQVFNYSRLVGLLFYAFDDSRLAASLFNVVFYMASVLSVFLLGRRLFDDRAAVWAAWLAACWPVFLLYETQTLRWVSTTAGLHLIILGTAMTMGRGRMVLSMLCALAGFFILLIDMPQFARLAYVVASAQAVVLLTVDLRARVWPFRAVRLAALAAVMVVAYDVGWVRAARDSAPDAPSPFSVPAAPAENSTPAALGGTSTPAALGGNSTPASGRSRFYELQVASDPSKISLFDQLVAPILETRMGYLKQNEELQESGIDVGTTLFARPLITSRDFLANVPTALASAIVAPTPALLLRAGSGATGLGPFVAAEVIAYYALLVMMCVGLKRSLFRNTESMLVTVYILLFTGAAYVIIGTVTMNGGTLHRFRLPYVVLHMVYAAPLLAAWVPALAQRVLGARR